MTRGKKIAAIFAAAAGLAVAGVEYLRQDLPSIAREQFNKVGVDIVSQKSHHVLKIPVPTRTRVLLCGQADIRRPPARGRLQQRRQLELVPVMIIAVDPRLRGNDR